MKKFVAAVLILMLAVALQAAQPQDSGQAQIEKGIFVIKQGPFQVVRESFSFERAPDESFRLSSQITLIGFGVEMAQELHLDHDLRPLAYTLTISSPQGVQEASAQIEGQQARLSIKADGQALERVVTSDREFIVIDNNVPSHFFVLYELLKKRAQDQMSFTALAPQVLAAPEVDAQRLAPIALMLADQKFEAQRHLLVLGATDAELYAADEKLIGVEIPSQGTLHRDDLFPGGFEVVFEPPAERPEGVKELEVSFLSGNLKLAGTLTLPEKQSAPVPAVLFIAGSGPMDRDENVAGLKYKIDFFKVLAYRLAQAGIGSLRYDKRGVAQSEGTFSKASFEDLVSDARAALAFLKSRPEVDNERVFVLGHSEGGEIAPLLSAEGAAEGLIIVAGNAHPLDWIILWQLELFLRAAGFSEEAIQEQLERQKAFNDWVKRSTGEWEDYTFEQLRELFPWLTREEFEKWKVFALSWYRQHFTRNPLETIRRLGVPVLILQGDKDVQVPKEEATLLADELRRSGNEKIELQILPDLNHLMRRHPERPNIGWTHLKEPVDERVLRLITAWLQGTK